MRFVTRPICPFLACKLILAASSRSQPAQDQLQSLFREGTEQMHAGDAAAAEAAFRKATEVDPSFAPVRVDLGLAQLKQGKLTEAIASIRKSLELDPASPGANSFLHRASYAAHSGLVRSLAAPFLPLLLLTSASAQSVSAVPAKFVDITASSGIHFQHKASHTSRKYLPETMG
jgi:tetratricopeptide (TPR) repeat protein